MSGHFRFPPELQNTARMVSIGLLIFNLVFLFISGYLIYIGITDKTDCKPRIPLIIIGILWVVSGLSQIGLFSWAVYQLNQNKA